VPDEQLGSKGAEGGRGGPNQDPEKSELPRPTDEDKKGGCSRGCLEGRKWRKASRRRARASD
jgi:hypothetical protein